MKGERHRESHGHSFTTSVTPVGARRAGGTTNRGPRRDVTRGREGQTRVPKERAAPLFPSCRRFLYSLNLLPLLTLVPRDRSDRGEGGTEVMRGRLTPRERETEGGGGERDRPLRSLHSLRHTGLLTHLIHHPHARLTHPSASLASRFGRSDETTIGDEE